MDTLKTVLKVFAAGTLILGGIAVGGTVLAAKGVNQVGDKLQEKLHS